MNDAILAYHIPVSVCDKDAFASSTPLVSLHIIAGLITDNGAIGMVNAHMSLHSDIFP
jgi:hypothetical protein